MDVTVFSTGVSSGSFRWHVGMAIISKQLITEKQQVWIPGGQAALRPEKEFCNKRLCGSKQGKEKENWDEVLADGPVVGLLKGLYAPCGFVLRPTALPHSPQCLGVPW